MVKIATTKAQRKLFFNLRRMLMKSESRGLSDADAGRIAAELGVKPAEVAEMHRRFASPDMPFDAAPGGEDDEDARAYPAQYLAADGGRDAEHDLAERDAARERKAALADALGSLDARSRAILQARRLDGGEEKNTLQRLAAEHGISAERVRQIEKRALAKVAAAVRSRLAAA
jgi:RNA polymerase sigma-32 factor